MTNIQIALNDPESAELARRVRQSGETPESIVTEIVRRNLAPWDPVEWRRIIEQTAGAWAGREDLPGFLTELRRESDERLEQLHS